jgi:hypothetical protein
MEGVVAEMPLYLADRKDFVPLLGEARLDDFLFSVVFLLLRGSAIIGRPVTSTLCPQPIFIFFKL